jgi:hypothetical protein
MKKNLLCLMTVVAITIVAAWNVIQSKNEIALTDVALENIEALADETSTGKAYVHCSGSDIICVGSGIYSCCV